MNLLKKIYIVILVFILSGCSVRYEIDIDRSVHLNEKIKVQALNEEEVEKIKNYSGKLPISIEIDDSMAFKKKLSGIDYYSIKKNSKNTDISFNYNYNVDKFNEDVFARTCYEYVTAMSSEDNLVLSTSNKFLCFEKFENLDEVIVTVTSKYKLRETNADVVEKHKYQWMITRENANNKYLYLSLDTTERDLTFWERLIEGEYTNMFTISLLLFIVGMFIYWFLKKKGEKRDKI